MVLVHHSWYICCILAAMHCLRGCCTDEEEYVKFRIGFGGSNFSYHLCNSFSFWNIEMIEIESRTASNGCSCKLHLPIQGGTLVMKDLSISQDEETESFPVITESSRRFTIGVSTKPRGYIYVKQMDHSKDWDYNFTELARFTNRGDPRYSQTFEWLSCSKVPQSVIHDRPKHATTTSTTRETVHTKPPTTVITSTDHGLPVSEKPTQASRKAIPTGIIAGGVLMVVVVALVVFVIACVICKRRQKTPKDIQKGPYVAVSANDRDIMFHGPSGESGSSSVSDRGTTPSVSNIPPNQLNTQTGEHVEYADIKPDSLAPKTAPDGKAVSGGDAGKPVLYADLAFHNGPAGDGDGKVDTGEGAAGAGMTEDQLSQMYAKPMKRK